MVQRKTLIEFQTWIEPVTSWTAGQVLYPLSNENLCRARSFNWVHNYVAGACFLHTARISTVEVMMSCHTSSADRASPRCSGGHGFDSCLGFRIFLCSTFVSCKGVARGGSWGACNPPPLCKPFCKQTTYNIQVTIWWAPSVWLSVTPLLKNPGYTHVMLISSFFTFYYQT